MEESFIRTALLRSYRVALNSPDPSSQCGAVIYDKEGVWVSDGWNDFTVGVPRSPERLERPLKYQFLEHAERNAIYASCFTKGHPLLMAAPWAACTECARGIVQSGIRILIRHKQIMDRSPAHWIDSIRFADDILLAGGVEIVEFDGRLGAAPILHDGEIWHP